MSDVADEIVVGEADAALDQALSDGLDAVNEAATTGITAQRELTVSLRDERGVVGGVSGWTWGTCAGIGMVWLRDDARGTGLGARLMTAFEDQARERGCVQVLVSSFTFQAPGFYESLGYAEFARSEGLPVAGHADVHFRKDL
ncbi:N-acetyltransferase [Nocardioides flavus (ex Wang et al. 2016)]|uniref:N-acetyltransferase n=1 Tax=Nocardioides flavus (ex Wang et al. 2016) TaxID=2058780 RepID=A0ABQ3HKP1_9ACTN|nr:GNAT family N-acetyltransferase [Nocardioides flavus (ex Wang et al. 2016)]GHE17478.1 N-acetyltransferase [Nocardioides flavus (ex Wang et al. 2016)]